MSTWSPSAPTSRAAPNATPTSDDIQSSFVRNSLQLCWCKPGYFRVTMLYRYVPFRSQEQTCVADGNKGWVDVYEGGRERPLECRPTTGDLT